MIDFAGLNRCLLEEARALLPEWLPGGRFVGREYVCANVGGGKGHSFGVNIYTGRWTDHATGQKGGDLISLYAETHGLSQGAAARELMGLSSISAPQPRSERRSEADDAERKSAAAIRIWMESRVADHLVAEYLRTRGLTLPTPPALRGHPSLRHCSGHVGPALTAGVQDASGKFIAIQRTWLKSDGSGKSDVEPCKMSLGPTGGGAVRLAEATSELVVCEGIETGLSYQQVTGRPTWACLGAPGLCAVEIPDCVRTLYIAADADEAGEQAAGVAAIRFMRRKGLAVKIARPSGAKDFNELLLRGATA
jgi:DNA primase